MAYGTIKVDTITFTDDGSDVSVSVSGLAKNPTISGDLTVTGNISGTVIQGSTTVSGATVTGTTANFISGVYTTQLSGATITGDAGQFTTLTGTTGNFVSGVFTTQLSGATITGDAGQFTTLTGNTAGFTTVTGTTVTGTTGNFVSGVFTTQVSGTTVTGNTGQFTTLTGGTAGFTTVTGTTVTGTTANFVTVSGTTVTGDAGNFTTATVTSGVFASGTAAAPSVSVGTTDNGLYSPGTDQVALSTNGVERVEFGTSEVVFNDVGADIDFRVEGDTEANLLLVDAGNDRIQIGGPIGVGGANFGSAGQVLVSNGSSAAPSWEDVTPSAVFGWDHDDDTYGLYLPGTSIKTSDLTGTVDIDVQSRMRRCVINDSGVVQYYLDADDSDLKAGDWLRIVETEALDTAYTGTHSESTNSLLRVGVPAWSAGTFTRGQRVTNGGYLWECIAASTTATPAAGTVASDLTGTDGQVMVEVPAFSVRYGYLNGVHTREVRLGCNDSLIAQGFQPHPAFIKTNGTYKDAFYIGAYHTYDDAGTGSSVSGQTNTRSQTRATFRTEASTRGTGWHVLSYLELAAIQTLLVCEFRDYNSQRAVGNGSDAGTTYGVTTGQSDADGNHSVNSTDNVSNADDYMAYRGIENLYGRAWQFVDGINVYERVVYLTNDQTAFDDDTSDGYEFYAQVPSGSSSYQKELQPLADVFLPSVVTGASSTTYLGDAFWTSTGWRVAAVGGSSGNGARVGAFALNLSFGSGLSGAVVGSRLAYAAN